MSRHQTHQNAKGNKCKNIENYRGLTKLKSSEPIFELFSNLTFISIPFTSKLNFIHHNLESLEINDIWVYSEDTQGCVNISSISLKSFIIKEKKFY